MLRKLSLVIITLITFSKAYSYPFDYTSNDNFTGLWSDIATWSYTPVYNTGEPITPGNPTHSNVADVNVYGYIRVASSLSVVNASPVIKIYDTLYVDGDLTLGSSASLSIQGGGVLIVTGTVTMGGAFALGNDGRMVVGGNFNVTNGTVTNNNDLYVYGTTTTSGGGTVNGSAIKDETDLEAEDEDLFNFVENGGVLPVELISFNGFTSQNILHLNWKTASEENFDYFQVEYAQSNLEFKPFDKIVKGHGNSTNINNYQFNQSIKAQQGPYYRLKIVDFDGVFEYSPIIFIQNSIPSSALEIFPNPGVSGQPVSVNCFECEESTVEIFNMSNHKVFESKVDFINQPAISPNLAAGIYVIKISLKGEAIVKRLVITE
jgi:hypothetical protein